MTKMQQVDIALQNNAIHCGGCEHRIRAVLGRLPGVFKVKADQKTQKVSLTLDTDKTSLSDVKKKLEAAGYPPG